MRKVRKGQPVTHISFECKPTDDQYEDIMIAAHRAGATNVVVTGFVPKFPVSKATPPKKTIRKKTAGKKTLRKRSS